MELCILELTADIYMLWMEPLENSDGYLQQAAKSLAALLLVQMELCMLEVLMEKFMLSATKTVKHMNILEDYVLVADSINLKDLRNR